MMYLLDEIWIDRFGKKKLRGKFEIFSFNP